jgi:hypothetical protein
MMMNSTNPNPSSLPSLPIVTPDLPRRSQSDKYGSLFYLGISGLIVVITFVGWFGYRTWMLRDVWANVYVLHDAREPEASRIQAAFHLSRDPRVEQGQLWEMSLRRGLPELARYILAEGIGSKLVAEDPTGYTTAVVMSPDWPAWLRLVLLRPLAYAATAGHTISREKLGELCRRDDPIVRLWALYALAVQNQSDPQTVVEIEHVAQADGPNRELAQTLLSAIHSEEAQRFALLDQATAWNRTHHPDASRLWDGWIIRDQRPAKAEAE